MKQNLPKQFIYEKILDISPDGFIIIDNEGLIIDVNKAYVDFVKLPKEKIVGKYITEIIPNSKLPKILSTGKTEVDAIHNLMEGQNPTKERVVAATRAPIIYNGEIIAGFGQVKFSKGTRELAKKLQTQESELEYYKKELKKILGNKYTFETMIGENENFLEVKNIAKKSAENDFTVLILGDTGTGKEVFAHSIHHASNRRDKPFIRVNCAAIPADLIESELFGYEEGTFTGAKKGGKIGKFELANGGTLFLDEVGELPFNMQAKLLRVLQEREVEKIGSEKPVPIDVRIIAATNQNIEKKVANNTFRADLYYRLNVIQIKNLPLRERVNDIPAFISFFLDDLNEKYGTTVSVSSEAKKHLLNYDYPGNIRELKNIIESAYSMAEGNTISPVHLPAGMFGKARKFIPNTQKTLERVMDDIEKDIMLESLKENNYNCVLTAKKLGIHRSTLYKKIEKYNIDLPR